MSLPSIVAELREWADDYRRDSLNGPTDPDEFFDGIADELTEYAEAAWLVVIGGAKDQKILDAAVARLQQAVVDD